MKIFKVFLRRSVGIFYVVVEDDDVFGRGKYLFIHQKARWQTRKNYLANALYNVDRLWPLV